MYNRMHIPPSTSLCTIVYNVNKLKRVSTPNFDQIFAGSAGFDLINQNDGFRDDIMLTVQDPAQDLISTDQIGMMNC